jgi:hypothetical protein
MLCWAARLLRGETQLYLDDTFNLSKIGSGQTTCSITQAQFADGCELISHGFVRFAVEGILLGK